MCWVARISQELKSVNNPVFDTILCMLIHSIGGIICAALVAFFPALNYSFLASELLKNAQYSPTRENPVAPASQCPQIHPFQYFSHERNVFGTADSIVFLGFQHLF